MSVRISSVLAMTLVLSSASVGLAADDQAKLRHRHGYIAPSVVPTPHSAFSGGRLVMHPALNIACNTRDRGTRALPCDQPVWVYGSPCQIDLGLGRWRDCDEPAPHRSRTNRW
jgi:hypothetical protein